MKRIVPVVAAVLAAGAVSAAPAGAASRSGVIASVSIRPASTQAGSDPLTTAAISMRYGRAGDTASTLALLLPPGFLEAPAAMPALCTRSELSGSRCPAASAIGTGSAVASSALSGLIGNTNASLKIFMMPAPSSKDIVGVGIEMSASALGIPISTTMSGTADFVNDAAGQPQLKINVPDLPTSVTALGLPIPIQLLSLTMKLDGTSPSGAQLIYMPTSCVPASPQISVTTAQGESGAGVDSFTPTGCPLAYRGGAVSSSGTASAWSNAATQTGLTFPAGGATTSAVTFSIPDGLEPNLHNAAVDCVGAPPYAGCVAIGSVTAATPLLSSPLTGTAYLTGALSRGLGIALYFPPPFNIALDARLQLGLHQQVFFTGIPDLPLTSLRLNLTGGPQSAFEATCAGGPQYVSAAFTGNGGAGTITESAPLGVATTGCPTGGGGGTPAVPSVRRGDVAGLASGRPSLRFTLVAGSGTLRSVAVSLPGGLSFTSASGVARALSVPGGARVTLHRGTLILTFKRHESTATVRIGDRGLRASSSLRAQAKRRRIRALTFRLVATNTSTGAALSFTVHRPY